jgi:hypothetical protein
MNYDPNPSIIEIKGSQGGLNRKRKYSVSKKRAIRDVNGS